ncbi:MAG: hypothetical protein ACERKV_01365 [Clostridiaceae bacterium]
MRLAEPEISKGILEVFYKRSDEIIQDGFVKYEYQKFAQKNTESYLRSFSGFGKWLSRIDRRLLNGVMLKGKYNKKQLLAMENYI